MLAAVLGAAAPAASFDLVAAELAKVVDRTTGLAQHNLSRSAATLVAPGMRHLRHGVPSPWRVRSSCV